MASGGGTKAVVAALAANLGIALAKFVGWLLTASSAMLAEAIHSVADSSNQALLLLGGKRAQRRASEVHQFGYGRSRYVAGFIVSIVLFTLGGLFALYEAWHKYTEPHPIEAWHWVPVVVLLVAMVMEALALRTALAEAKQVRGKSSLLEFIKRSRSPEIPTIVMEDTGALVGLVFALFGVGMTLATHDGRWDAVGSAAIGVLLVVIAGFLAREMTSMLLGESALPEHHRAIEEALRGAGEAEPGITELVELRTLHLGPDEVLVAAKVKLAPEATAEEVSRAIDAAEARVRDAVPLRIVSYVEPDLHDAPETGRQEEDAAGRA